jgi:hypothetical protein
MNPGLGSYQFPRLGGIAIVHLRLTRGDTLAVNKKNAVSILHNRYLNNNGRAHFSPATDAASAQNSLNLEVWAACQVAPSLAMPFEPKRLRALRDLGALMFPFMGDSMREHLSIQVRPLVFIRRILSRAAPSATY